jgi:hypothetical protein
MPEIYAFIAVQDEYLDDMIYVEGRGLNGHSCAGCESPNPVFQCADEECVGLGMRCEECIVKAHQHLPFHWIEVCLHFSLVNYGSSSVPGVGW